jgi:hypothetical protein
MNLYNKAALRTARQQRLAQKPDAVQAEQSKSETAVVAGTQEDVKPEVSGYLTASVLDPKDVTKSAELNLQLFNAGSSDPHWLVCADGQPLAQIRLSDQEDAERIAKVFSTEGYANGFIQAASQMELSEVLASVRARPYVSTIASSDAYRAIEAQVKAEGLAEIRRAKANLRNDMLNALNLVVVANSKNFITENPLKESLFARMKAAGFESDRAVAIIEAAFQEKASEYFDFAFKKAMEWSALAPEVYSQMEEQINNFPQRTPAVEADDDYQVAASHNVNLMTYTAAADLQAPSEKDHLRSIFGPNLTAAPKSGRR